MELLTLQEVIAGWPETAPGDATELQFCDDAELQARGLEGEELEQVRQLRAQVRRAAMSWSRTTALGTPAQVEEALGRGDLRLLSKRWLTLALDEKRRRTFVPFSADSSRTVEKITRVVPEAEWLPKLPRGGVYLLLWGGGPDVLDIDDVRQRLTTLQNEVPVADVVLRKLESGPKSTLYSLRQGFGVCNRQRIEFPNKDHVAQAAMWERNLG